MTCQEAAETLFDVVAGEAPADLSVAFAEHLTLCLPCAALLSSYQGTILLARRLSPRELPPTLTTRLCQIVAKHQPSQ
jgi:hypothetical protein